MRTEAALRPFVWELMGRLEQAALGTHQRVSEQRDRFDLNRHHPAARTLSERPESRGFIRADRGSLLFRNASAQLRTAVPPELANRAMPSAKGLEFRWTQLDHSDIRRLFETVAQLANLQPEAAADGPVTVIPSVAAAPASPGFSYEFHSGGIDPHHALIYLWEVLGESDQVLYRYVGKAKNGDGRPIEHYRRNVLNLLRGQPYRKGKPDGYRAIHRRLAAAMVSGERVRLSFVCNVSNADDIDEVESSWQRHYGC